MCHRRAAAEQLAADLGQAVMHLSPHKKPRTQETQERLLSSLPASRPTPIKAATPALRLAIHA